MGQSVSDVFYPNNPDRRNRAEQLKHDIESFASQYEEIKRTRDRLLTEIGPRLATLLRNEGYDTPEKLDEKVQSVLKGPNLEKYLEVKATYDRTSELERTVFAISSYISIGSALFLGGLALLGVITGGVAFAALGAVAGVLAVVGGVLVLLAAIEGAKERANLRDVINRLGPERVRVRRALVLMQAISSWAKYIKTYLDSVIVNKHPEMEADIWEGDFKKDFALSEHDTVVQWLVNFDRERGAWTDEDGDWKTDRSPRRAAALSANQSGFLATRDFQQGPASLVGNFGTTLEVQEDITLPGFGESGVDAQPKVILHRTVGTDEPQSLSMTIINTAPDLCIARDDHGEKWALLPETITLAEKAVNLSVNNVIFSIRKLSNGEVYHDFRVLDLTSVF